MSLNTSVYYQGSSRKQWARHLLARQAAPNIKISTADSSSVDSQGKPLPSVCRALRGAVLPTNFNRLPVLRTERGLSRQDLAEALGINYQAIGYIERGEYNPSLELAFRLSEFFGLPIEAMFSRQPFRPLSELVYSQIREER